MIRAVASWRAIDARLIKSSFSLSRVLPMNFSFVHLVQKDLIDIDESPRENLVDSKLVQNIQDILRHECRGMIAVDKLVVENASLLFEEDRASPKGSHSLQL